MLRPTLTATPTSPETMAGHGQNSSHTSSRSANLQLSVQALAQNVKYIVRDRCSSIRRPRYHGRNRHVLPRKLTFNIYKYSCARSVTYVVAIQGTAGPLGISLPGYSLALDEKVISTTLELEEFPFVLDMNSGSPLGVGEL